MSINQVRQWLKKDGYKSLGHGVYMKGDHKLSLYNWVDGLENWDRWWKNGRLPQPPQKFATIKGEWWQIDVYSGENGRYCEFKQLPRIMGENELKEMAERIIQGLGENVL